MNEAVKESFCPYVGLRPYDEEHREYFFGRSGDVRVICAAVLAVPICVLYGPSGVGKSSVLLAGVIPLLRNRKKTVVVAFREWQRPDAVTKIKTLCVEAASRACGHPIEVDVAQPLDEVLLRASRAFGGNFVILLDQFEEYFLYHPDADDAAAFDGEFARSINREDVDAGFLLSMREDGLSKLDRFKIRIPNLLSNTIRLDYLDDGSAAEAITEPLRVFNEHYRPTPEYGVEPALVQRILAQVKSVKPDGSRGQIETPLLQLVMMRLWKEEAALGSHVLRISTFQDRLRDVRSLLQTHLSEVMDTLDETDQSLCARFFDRLVTPSGSKLACRVDDLVKWAQADAGAVRKVAEQLDRERILRGIDPPPGQTVRSYEIFHDVLAPAVLGWCQKYVASDNERKALAQAAAEAEERAQEVIAQQKVATALEVGRLEKLRADAESRSARRFRWVAWGLAAMTVVAVGFATVAWFKAKEADRNADVAQLDRGEAVNQRNLAQKNGKLAFARELAGQARSVQPADPELSVILALHAASIAKPIPSEVKSALNESVFAARIRHNLRPDQGTGIRGIAYSPDGAYLAAVSDRGTVDVWNAAELSEPKPLRSFTGQIPDGSAPVAFSNDSTRIATATDKHEVIVQSVRPGGPSPVILGGHLDAITAIAFAPKGNFVASCALDGTTRLWSLDHPSARPLIFKDADKQATQALAFHPDGRQLATGSSDYTVKIWDTSGRNPPRTLRGHHEAVESVAFSADGRELASASADRTVIVWDTRSWAKKRVLKGHVDAVFAVRYGAKDRLIATGGADGGVVIWDAASGQELFGLNGHTGPIAALAFSPNGTQLASASWDGTLRIWSVSPVHLEGITAMAVSTGGEFVATASMDNTAMIWDATSGEVMRTLRGHREHLSAIALSADGTLLVTGDEGGNTIFWSVATEDVGQRLGKQDATITNAKFSPKGTFVASSAYDGTVLVWRTRNLNAGPKRLEGTGYPLEALSFSPDESRIAAASGDGVIIWELADQSRPLPKAGRLFRTKQESSIKSVAFSSDGKLLAGGGFDASVSVWNALNGDLKYNLIGHEGQILDVTFSPDDSLLVSAGVDNVAIIWDLAAGTNHKLEGHRLPIVSVRFSPDGTQLATASWDRTARVWEATTGQETGSYSHAGPVLAAEFSPDGKRLYTAGGERGLRVNLLDTGSLQALARSRIKRALSPGECERYLHDRNCPALR